MPGRTKPLIGVGAALALAGAAAGVAYGWGVGLFHPCGPLDGALGFGGCRLVTTLDGTVVDELLPQGDGRVLAVLGEAVPEPERPPRLAQLALPGGRLENEVELALPPDARVLGAASSPDGTRVALGLVDEPARVVDRATGAVVSGIPLSLASSLAFDGPDRILVQWNNTDEHRAPILVARAFDASTGVALPDVEGGATLPLFQGGVSRALSPDGALLAQHAPTTGASGVVAVRLTSAESPDFVGELLVAPLGVGRLSSGHVLPWLWFSPSGEHLAASFDSAPVWGRQTSALVIWEVESQEMVRRIPTHTGQWRNLVWLEDRRQVVVSRFNLDRRRAEVAVIDY